jgi:hypothetical protein
MKKWIIGVIIILFFVSNILALGSNGLPSENQVKNYVNKLIAEYNNYYLRDNPSPEDFKFYSLHNPYNQNFKVTAIRTDADYNSTITLIFDPFSKDLLVEVDYSRASNNHFIHISGDSDVILQNNTFYEGGKLVEYQFFRMVVPTYNIIYDPDNFAKYKALEQYLSDMDTKRRSKLHSKWDIYKSEHSNSIPEEISRKLEFEINMNKTYTLEDYNRDIKYVNLIVEWNDYKIEHLSSLPKKKVQDFESNLFTNPNYTYIDFNRDFGAIKKDVEWEETPLINKILYYLNIILTIFGIPGIILSFYEIHKLYKKYNFKKKKITKPNETI